MDTVFSIIALSPGSLLKVKLTNLLHWLFALTFVGFGIYSLVEIGDAVMKSKGDWFSLWMAALLFLVLVLVPLSMGYLIYRRRYHELCSVLAMLGSIVLCFILMGLPSLFGWRRGFDWLNNTASLEAEISQAFLGLFMSLLFLFGPFFVAAWFHRMCIRLADRYLAASKPQRWPAANAATEK